MADGTCLAARGSGGWTNRMTTGYERLQELFVAACDLPPQQQLDWLDQLRGEDLNFKGDLELLLGKDSSGPGILSDGNITAGIEYQRESPDFDIPQRIGRYRVKRMLGQGGMGVVYLAEQENPRRDVAIKVIRPSIFNRELVKRFKTETTVLGLLQHPGIAQILEAGTANVRLSSAQEFSLPFFAMEFVDGLPITQFAAQRGFSIRKKLQLIGDVCRAVHSLRPVGAFSPCYGFS